MSGPSRFVLDDDLDAPPPYNPEGDLGVEHRYPLSDRSQKQWGVLTLASAAKSPRSTPIYYEGDAVRGTFEMEVDNADSIRSINILVRWGCIAQDAPC
jgi:hypothetical protein